MNKPITVRLERAFMRVERYMSLLYFSIRLTPHSKRTGVPGFTLIELLIATFIASILGVLLFSALYQVNRFVPVVDNTTATYEKAALLNAQFERDISGVTAPNEFYYRQPEPSADAKAKADKEKKAKQEAAADAKAKADKEKKEKEAEKEGEKKPKKPLEKIFYSTNKDGMFNQLSFITNNPLQIYWSAKSGSPKPRIARVLYQLKEEKGTPKSYSLIRKESANLEFDQIIKEGKEGPQEYVLAEGIKSLTAEYTYYVPEPKPSPQQAAQTGEAAQVEKKEAASKEPKKKEIKKTATWIAPEVTPGAQIEQASVPGKEQLPLVPQLVELKIALWDAQKKRSTPFIFKVRVQSDIPEKRETEDVTQRLLGTLREFFTQSFTPPSPTRVTQRNQFNLPRGQLRR